MNGIRQFQFGNSAKFSSLHQDRSADRADLQPWCRGGEQADIELAFIVVTDADRLDKNFSQGHLARDKSGWLAKTNEPQHADQVLPNGVVRIGFEGSNKNVAVEIDPLELH